MADPPSEITSVHAKTSSEPRERSNSIEACGYLRASDIERLLGISVRTVRRWIALEILPSVKLGGTRLVPREALERLLLPTPTHWDEGEEEPE